jgi:hypothetical protein
MKTYTINKVPSPPHPDDPWESAVWERAQTAGLFFVCPESSCHRPATAVRLLYTDDRIAGMFRVDDCYVRCVHTHYRDPVYNDSCVEFFFLPCNNSGYFSFEFNCGGAFLANLIHDPARVDGGVRGYIPLSLADCTDVKVWATLPPVIDPEITVPVTWYLGFHIPFSLIERYGPLSAITPGVEWSGNFFKCADATSHPHWLSWAPLAKKNFHDPGCFGTLQFG